MKKLGIIIYKIIKWCFYLITLQQLFILIDGFMTGAYGDSNIFLDNIISFITILTIAFILTIIPILYTKDMEYLGVRTKDDINS